MILAPGEGRATYRNGFTGETGRGQRPRWASRAPLAAVFAIFPVAMLARTDAV